MDKYKQFGVIHGKVHRAVLKNGQWVGLCGCATYPWEEVFIDKHVTCKRCLARMEKEEEERGTETQR
jgi:hypothetical protein